MSKAEWHYTAPFQKEARLSAKDIVGGILSGEEGVNSFESTIPGDREEGHFGFWANYVGGKEITLQHVARLSHLFHEDFIRFGTPITGLRCLFDATKDGDATVVPHLRERLSLSVLEQRHILPQEIVRIMFVVFSSLKVVMDRIELETILGDEPAEGMVSVNLIFQPRASSSNDAAYVESTRNIAARSFTQTGLALSPENFSSEWLQRK